VDEEVFEKANGEELQEIVIYQTNLVYIPQSAIGHNKVLP